MTQILRGKSVSQGLLITRPRCHANRLHVWGGGRGGELSQNRLHQTLQIITTVVSRGPEDTSDSPNGFLTTRGPTAPPTPCRHLHSTVSPSTANNCWPRIWPPLPASDGHRGPSKSPLCSQPPCIQRQHLPLDSGPSAPVAAAPPLLYAHRALQSSKPPHTHLRETGGGQSVPSLTM